MTAIKSILSALWMQNHKEYKQELLVIEYKLLILFKKKTLNTQSLWLILALHSFWKPGKY